MIRRQFLSLRSVHLFPPEKALLIYQQYPKMDNFYQSQDWMLLWNQHATLNGYKEIFVAIQRGLEQFTKQFNKAFYEVYLGRVKGKLSEPYNLDASYDK